MTVLVEGFDAEAIALANLLAAEGETVRLAGRGDAPSDRAVLRSLGVQVEPHADLDADPGYASVAYLDVWTPETAPRVQRLRERGARISCLADLLLERWPGPSIGITGTAGKTSTTALTATILDREGIDVAVSSGARAANLWPTADLLAALEAEELSRRSGSHNARTLLLELTSSHLAFMTHSPTVAAIVSFWPDHLELHGSLERYRVAKATIARHQRSDDVLVVNADDAAGTFSDAARGRVHSFSLRRPVPVGAFLRDEGTVVLVGQDGVEHCCRLRSRQTTHPGNLVAAAAIASAAGASPAAVDAGLAAATALPYRARRIGAIAGVVWIDDGMAATPAKTAALVARYRDRSIVLIAGGLDDAGGGRVHAAREELELLERACDEVARCARAVVLFGDAGGRLRPLLASRGVTLHETDDLRAAVVAAAELADGAAAVVFSPLHPVSAADRASFESLAVRQR